MADVVLATPELLAIVFAHLDLPELLPLRRVCSTWDAAARDTPAYWRDVSLELEELTQGLLEFFLLRLCGDARPGVRATFEALTIEPAIAQRVIPGIASVLHRLSLLRLGLLPEYAPPLLAALLYAPAPLLQTLDLCFDTEDGEHAQLIELPRDVFAGVAPRLTRLVLFDVLLPPNAPPVLAHVQYAELYLDLSAYGDAEYARVVERIFGHLPALRELQLSLGERAWDPAVFLGSAVRARAAQLHTLGVTGWERDLVRWLPTAHVRRLSIVDTVGSLAFELSAELADAPPFGPGKPLGLAFVGRTARLVTDDGYELHLQDAPLDYPSWLRAWMGLPGLADRIVSLGIPCEMWLNLCDCGVALPALDRLTLLLRGGAAGTTEGVLRCPVLRAVTFAVVGGVSVQVAAQMQQQVIQRNLLRGNGPLHVQSVGAGDDDYLFL